MSLIIHVERVARRGLRAWRSRRGWNVAVVPDSHVVGRRPVSSQVPVMRILLLLKEVLSGSWLEPVRTISHLARQKKLPNCPL